MGDGNLSRSYQFQNYEQSLVEDSSMARILSISIPWQIHRVDIWLVCKVIAIIMLVIHRFLNLMFPISSWVWISWYHFNIAAYLYRDNSHHKIYKVVFFPFSGINHLSVCTIHIFTTYFFGQFVLYSQQPKKLFKMWQSGFDVDKSSSVSVGRDLRSSCAFSAHMLSPFCCLPPRGKFSLFCDFSPQRDLFSSTSCLLLWGTQSTSLPTSWKTFQGCLPSNLVDLFGLQKNFLLFSWFLVSAKYLDHSGSIIVFL